MAKKKTPSKKKSARKAAPKRKSAAKKKPAARKKPQQKAAKRKPATKKPQAAALPHPMQSEQTSSHVCGDGSCKSRGGLAFVGCMFLGMGLGSMAGAPGAGTLLGMGAGFLVMKRCNTSQCR